MKSLLIATVLQADNNLMHTKRERILFEMQVPNRDCFLQQPEIVHGLFSDPSINCYSVIEVSYSPPNIKT